MKPIDVSVVLAVKNEQVYIEKALQSILFQTGLSYEVIVIDDGSLDRTFLIVEEICAIHDNIKLHRNPRSGKCSAFNYGVDLAKGKFICIFAGDDIMPEGSLAARWRTVCTSSEDIPVVGLCKLVTMSEVKKLNGHLIPRAAGRSALSGVSPLMNRLALKKIFPVPEVLPNEDTWMELAILHFKKLTVIHSAIVGCNWRLHSGNSINMLVRYPEYNQKITVRLRAYSLFYETHKNELDEIQKLKLLAKVDCERFRSSGSLLGVLRSRVGLVDKLRALSITNNFLYSLRRGMYGLFSGW